MRIGYRNIFTWEHISLAIFIALVIGYFGYLYYHVITSFDEQTLNTHVEFAENLMNGGSMRENLNLPHVGYFYSLIFLYKLGFSFDTAAILLLVAGNLLAFISVYAVYKVLVPEEQLHFVILVAAFISLIVGSLYLPFLNPNMYFGQGSPNSHHNSTLTMLRPFAVLGFFMVTYKFESIHKERWRMLLASLVLFLGVIFKPTFIIVFLPAIGLYLLFQPDRIRNIFWLGIISLPAILALAYEYLSFYELVPRSRDNTIQFLEVWGHLSPNIPLSIFQALAFPMLISLFRWRKLAYPRIFIVAWLVLLIGMVQFAFLAETSANGRILLSANWIGGYLMGMMILYTVCIMEGVIWLKEYRGLARSERIAFWITALFLLGHLISGFITDYSIWLQGGPHPF